MLYGICVSGIAKTPLDQTKLNLAKRWLDKILANAAQIRSTIEQEPTLLGEQSDVPRHTRSMLDTDRPLSLSKTMQPCSSAVMMCSTRRRNPRQRSDSLACL